MPAVINVQSRDIYVLVEFSLEEIQKIVKVMDLMQLNYDGTKKDDVEAQKYLVEQLYPFFKQTKKELMDEPDDK